jgi:hypothetical protein
MRISSGVSASMTGPWGAAGVRNRPRDIARRMDPKTGVNVYIEEIEYLDRTGKEFNT